MRSPPPLFKGSGGLATAHCKIQPTREKNQSTLCMCFLRELCTCVFTQLYCMCASIYMSACVLKVCVCVPVYVNVFACILGNSFCERRGRVG